MTAIAVLGLGGATERLMHRLPVGIELLVANFALLSTLVALGESLALAEDACLMRDQAFDVLDATLLGAQAERRRAAVGPGNTRRGSSSSSPILGR
jgi:3-hydroxyisobutyrate dehydrogenase